MSRPQPPMLSQFHPMAIESRSRMISFRLTDQEYDRFRRVCIARGLRNVSELVRAAVNQLAANEDYEPASIAPQMDARLTHLETKMAELLLIISDLQAREPGETRVSTAAANAFIPPSPKN